MPTTMPNIHRDAQPLAYSTDNKVTDDATDYSEVGLSIDQFISIVLNNRYEVTAKLAQIQGKIVDNKNEQLRVLGALKAELIKYSKNVEDPGKKIDKLDGAELARLQALAVDKDGNQVIDVYQAFGITPPNEAKAQYIMSVRNSGFGKMLQGRSDEEVFAIGQKLSHAIFMFPQYVEPQATQGQLAGALTKLDTAISSVSNIQNVEYNKLQDLSQKLTQALELASNFLKKFFDMRSGVIRNIS